MFHIISRSIAPDLSSCPARRCIGTLSKKASSDPLRILFCGSDAFSCASLRALHSENVQNRGLVEALDVMVLPGKRTGRGLKQIREVPCKTVAEELGLPIHQRDTFRNWNLPNGTNLVVVVSFGLFVPPRILSCAKYGGINVHPSLLPDLRGPAPIHHALLRGDAHIGISLQTLDDKAFDHGTILGQTPSPGLPIPPGATLHDILPDAAQRGAQMLIQGLRDGVHVPPHQDVGWKAAQLAGKELWHAPKVTKADGQVDWSTWTAEQFTRRVRVLGSVWTYAVGNKGPSKRVIFLDAELVAPDEEMTPLLKKEGTGTLLCEHGTRAERCQITVVSDEDGSCLVRVHDSPIRVRKVKVDGKPEQVAAIGLKAFIT
ncbi:Methionyl-tRNA formyltransferase [Conoideocrella luteorostrata]|uniref:methionyl-tRNA formyltransferase n=1 Tax=Conoideocrella luteorostrata TaxID=1105319 RepID=A0AAJ0FQ75_9HYPO|nr:Methionyl-tRNA formyltransferase [Conoideocrella luteorostrata]